MQFSLQLQGAADPALVLQAPAGCSSCCAAVAADHREFGNCNTIQQSAAGQFRSLSPGTVGPTQVCHWGVTRRAGTSACGLFAKPLHTVTKVICTFTLYSSCSTHSVQLLVPCGDRIPCIPASTGHMTQHSNLCSYKTHPKPTQHPQQPSQDDQIGSSQGLSLYTEMRGAVSATNNSTAGAPCTPEVAATAAVAAAPAGAGPAAGGAQQQHMALTFLL